jgi:hypothetical protein
MSRKSMLLALLLAILAFGLGVRGNAQANYTTTWLGNSLGGAAGSWMQISAGGVYTEPDGTTYVNSTYDEAGHEAGIYQEGSPVGYFGDLHGWGRSGGVSITTDNKYVYLGMVQRDARFAGAPPPGYPLASTSASGAALRGSWWGVRRYFRNGQPAPWTQSSRVNGDTNSIVGMYDNSMIIVSDVSYSETNAPTDTAITGLAAVNGLLYVSDPHTNSIRVYNVANPNRVAAVGMWSFANPGSIVFDKNTRTLWIAQIGDSSRLPAVLHYTLDGIRLPQQIAGMGIPRGLAFDPDGRLLVADSGPDQQVKIYINLDTLPLLVSTLGAPGGIYSGVRGQAGDDKFNGLTGVASDAAGNTYVTTNGSEALDVWGTGCMLASYTSEGKRRWKLEGMEFMDCADVAPGSDGADIYTKEEHFKLDLTDPLAAPQFAGYTIDRVRYPNDSRLHVNTSSSPLVRNIFGKKFLFVQDTYSQYLQIYRFDAKNAGETAIPSGMICVRRGTVGKASAPWPPANVQPDQGPWIWRDIDGNGDFYKNGAAQKNEFDNGLAGNDPWLWAGVWGWCVDENGDIWQSSRNTSVLNGGIRRFRCLGLDALGNPMYSMASSQIQARPAPFDGINGSINRIEYVAATDTMYLSGYTNAHPMTPNEWGIVGRVIVRYDRWSTSARTAAYQIVLPWNMTTNPLICARAVTVSGGKIFVGYLSGASLSYGSNGGQILIYDGATGKPLGQMSPGPEVGNTSGWIDTPSGIRAFTRSSGEQFVFTEEDFMGKVLMYRIPAPGTASTVPVIPWGGSGAGLLGKYFNGSMQTAFGQLVSTRVDPVVDFQSLTSPSAVSQASSSTQWTGKVQPRYSETYTFHTNSRGGVRVWVGGKMIVDSWKSHLLQADFGSIALQAGKLYNIRIEYYQYSGASALTLAWSSASQLKEVIPQSQLYPDAK